MNIYVASSWRNELQPLVVDRLRAAGHNVYDFRNAKTAFNWADIDENWENWSIPEFKNALKHPIAQRGRKTDMDALEVSEVFILLLPCGNDAHFEFGWAHGRELLTIVFIPKFPAAPITPFKPGLAYASCDAITTTLQETIDLLRQWDPT